MTPTEKPKVSRDSLRQKTLAKLIVENHGKSPIGKLMIQAGYTKAYSTNPKELKKTLNWQQLMDKYLPDDLLTKKHQALLNKREFIVVGKKGDREVLPTGEVDAYAVSQGLALAYKVKDKNPIERHKVDGTIKTINIVSYGDK